MCEYQTTWHFGFFENFVLIGSLSLRGVGSFCALFAVEGLPKLPSISLDRWILFLNFDSDVMHCRLTPQPKLQTERYQGVPSGIFLLKEGRGHSVILDLLLFLVCTSRRLIRGLLQISESNCCVVFKT